MLWIAVALASEPEPEIEGAYALAETPESLSATHEAAVQAALRNLPFAFRPFARGPLRRAVQNCDRLDLDLDGHAFKLACDEEPAYIHDLAAPETRITGDDGKPYQVDLALRSDEAILSFTGEDGGQRNRYALQDDGSLEVTTELFSPRLSAPVSWKVLYKRRK